MSHVLEHIPVAGKVVGEVVALGTIAGAFLDWLPTVAAVLAIFWHVILIYDWATCKIRRNRRKGDNNNNKE